MSSIHFLFNAIRQNRNWKLSSVVSRLARLSLLCVHQRSHRRVCRSLSQPKLSRFAAAYPQTALKYLNHLYLARRLSTAARASALAHHYHYLHDAFEAKFLDRLLLGRLSLWAAPPADDEFDVALGFSNESRHEGELTLYLRHGDRDIFHLAFSIVPAPLFGSQGRHALLITRLQGRNGCFAEIRQFTKQMREVAPPALLFAALKGIAEALAIDEIIGVCASDQIYNRHATDEFSTAYDQHWRALGAEPLPCGFYRIPRTTPEKPIESIVPKHRRRTLLKRALKHEIAETIKQAFLHQARFGTPPPDPASLPSYPQRSGEPSPTARTVSPAASPILHAH